jgi:NAD(P)-dependent dehydrogenase (short-subunit alcohol dehydrogenase family)
MKIENSIIVITGASSGIGAETAKYLAGKGAKVVLSARREAELQALAAEIQRDGGTALAVAGDVGNAGDVRRLMDETVAKFGRVDALINNAGMGGGLNLSDTRDELLEQVLKVNVLGCALCAKYALPHMAPGGVVINIGSVAGEVATVGMYTASKFAVRGFNEALRREFRHHGIDVVLVAPGFIRTEMTQGLKMRMPGPEVVARAIESGLRRPRRKIVVPWFYRPIMYFGKIPFIADLIFGRKSVQDNYKDRESVRKLNS